jgi:hypothetical protein
MPKTTHVSVQFRRFDAIEQEDKREIAAMFRHHTGRSFGTHVRENFAAAPNTSHKVVGPLTFSLRSVLPNHIS